LLIIILLCANFNTYLPFGDEIMTEKTIVDLMTILLAKKDHGNVNTNLKIVIDGAKIGAISINEEIEHVPSETERKTAK